MFYYFVLVSFSVGLLCAAIFMFILGGHGNINGKGFKFSFTFPFITLPIYFSHLLLILACFQYGDFEFSYYGLMIIPAFYLYLYLKTSLTFVELLQMFLLGNLIKTIKD